MTSKSTILLFEDTEANANKIKKFITPLLAENFEIKDFSAKHLTSEESFVTRLTAEVSEYENVSLIVSDMDLSKTNNYKGLTDAVITRVAHNLGIPTAYYSTALDHRQDQAGDGRILLGSTDYEKIARKISFLASGFCSIKTSINAVLALATADRPKDAATFLSNLIGRPEVHHRLSLYVSGDQRMGAEILSSPKDHPAARQSMIFGTWIYDSLMRYPGVLLNSTATASYLNINAEEFSSNHIVQELWHEALYSGPFADSASPLYWRDKLDRIISLSKFDDGYEYAASKSKSVTPCFCSIDPSIPAGYYCMITEKPVSYENSVGNISWFPPGADLARIAKPKYEELAPWLGV